MSDVTGLGLLAIGASPGGGGSNVFAYLLGGDLELSITMSFISTVFSLGKTQSSRDVQNEAVREDVSVGASGCVWLSVTVCGCLWLSVGV